MIRILFSLILALCIPAYAVSPDALKLDRPVIDQAEILSDAQEAALATRLRGWYDDGLMQAAVVIVDSTDGIPLKDYSQTLFARWQLGDASKNDGLLILIAHRDHRLRIQPGRGLDDILSTDRLQDIINTRITPAFKRGDYAGGIDSGLDAIVSRLTAPPPAPVTQRDYNFFLLTLVCTCVLGWHLGKRRRFRIYIPPLCGTGLALFGIFYDVNSGLVFGSVILLILGSTILAWLRIALGKAQTNTADSPAGLEEADDDNDDGNDGDDVNKVDTAACRRERRERRDDSDSYRSTYSSSDSDSSSYDGGGGSSSDSGGADGSW